MIERTAAKVNVHSLLTSMYIQFIIMYIEKQHELLASLDSITSSSPSNKEFDMPTVNDSPVSDKLDQRAAAIIAAGLVVHLDSDGGSVANPVGVIYRVDLDLGGRPNCQCRSFEFHGDCKHLRAIRMAHESETVEVDRAEWTALVTEVINSLPFETCPECGGSGTIIDAFDNEVMCPTCSGDTVAAIKRGYVYEAVQS